MNTATETKTNIFDTKEQYLAFRNHWRKLYADGFHKRVKHEYKNGSAINYETWTPIPPLHETGFYMESPLSAFHHLVFNIVTGRDPFRAFKEKPEKKYTFTQTGAKLYYSKDFSAFGETLNTEQQDKILKTIQELARHL